MKLLNFLTVQYLNFFQRGQLVQISVLSMLGFEIIGISGMIVSITLSSITPLVASLPFCLLISLRSSVSESIFLTLRITVVLFWRLTFLDPSLDVFLQIPGVLKNFRAFAA